MNDWIHPWLHPVFEVLGYAAAYALYRRSVHRDGDGMDDDQRSRMIAAAAIGALIGSRILGLLDQAPRLHFTWTTLLLPGGRTAVGGLLGAWIAVALCDRSHGRYARSSDLFVLPLCVGIAVGRIGCFVSGLADGTQGRATGLPWGVNFGDGILRHPTPLYEVFFLAALATVFHRFRRRPHADGSVFRSFVAAYLTWRLLIDFMKPETLLRGLSLIQWACVIGLLVLLAGLVRRLPIHSSAIRSHS